MGIAYNDDNRYEVSHHAYESGSTPDDELLFLEHVKAKALFDSPLETDLGAWQHWRIAQTQERRYHIEHSQKVESAKKSVLLNYFLEYEWH